MPVTDVCTTDTVCLSVSYVPVWMLSDNASTRCMYSWQYGCLCVCLSVTYWCRWCQKMPERYVQLTMCVCLCVSVSVVVVSMMSDNASQRCMYSWQCVCLSVTYWCRWCQTMPVRDVCTADNVCVSLCVSVSDVLVSMMSDNASQRCMHSWQCVCLCVCLSVTYWCRWCQKMPVRDVSTEDNVCGCVCLCHWDTCYCTYMLHVFKLFLVLSSCSALRPQECQ